MQKYDERAKSGQKLFHGIFRDAEVLSEGYPENFFADYERRLVQMRHLGAFTWNHLKVPEFLIEICRISITGSLTPSKGTIAGAIALCEGTVAEALSRMRDWGLIRWEQRHEWRREWGIWYRRQTGNTYVLTMPRGPLPTREEVAAWKAARAPARARWRSRDAAEKAGTCLQLAATAPDAVVAATDEMVAAVQPAATPTSTIVADAAAAAAAAVCAAQGGMGAVAAAIVVDPVIEMARVLLRRAAQIAGFITPADHRKNGGISSPPVPESRRAGARERHTVEEQLRHFSPEAIAHSRAMWEARAAAQRGRWGAP